MKGTHPRHLGCLAARAGLMAALALFVTTPAQAIRVATYNVLNFPGSDGSTRVDDFRIALDQVFPDVLVVQEMLSQAGVTQFLNDVLNHDHPGMYAAGPFVNGPDTDNALFYKVAVVQFISHEEIPTALRNISEYVLKPVEYASPTAQFRVYSFHFKAGTSSSDEQDRLAEATILRNHLNGLPTGTHFVLGGDYNIYSSSEPAYQVLVGSQADNDGRGKDPISTPGGWHDNAAYASVHTQSTRTASFGGGATGGMDDRFDQLLISYPFDDGSGLSYVPGSYVSYGNDGQHFNLAINSGTNYAVGPIIADALHQASDHLPVFADFQVPALIDAPTSLALGDAIVGGSRTEPLPVGNEATAPADELSYTLAYPVGFGGPTGPFVLTAGAYTSHDVSLNTSSVGVKSGTLTVSSNDPDHPTSGVALSGTVLRHASPSLAPSAVVLSDTLDFGVHPPDEFTPGVVSASNVGFDALQALLEVHSAQIAGGDGRFSIVGGFTPAEVGVTPAEYTVAFDAEGAAGESLYTAILTFETRDDWDKAGATSLASLHVALRAFVEEGSSVGDEEILALALERSAPNPFSDRAALVLTLPRDADVLVDVFDVRGRHVRTLVSGGLPRGTHEVGWNGRDDAGADVASGVYFCSARVGDVTMARRLVLIR